jgi:hypothetical protein
MSLADKLKSTPRSEPGLPCGVGRLLNELDSNDKRALEAVFSERSRPGTISNVQIHQILLSEGHDIAFASISMHRRRQCRCFVGKNSQLRQELAKKGS